jgi:hypothetical protein
VISNNFGTAQVSNKNQNAVNDISTLNSDDKLINSTKVNSTEAQTFAVCLNKQIQTIVFST